jgi:DNA-binding GntR family transcriptional regulator
MEYRTKEEQVADFLREGIISGQFPRGSRIKQAQIAEQLQLSITPVREALKMLEAEGYLTGDSYRGRRVVPFDEQASTEILNLRITLESQLVRAAVEKASGEHIAELRALAAEFEQASIKGDRIATRGVNYRLHSRMYDLAELPQTFHFVQILWARYPFDLINGIKGRTGDAVAEHTEIINAFIERDVTGAMLALRRHVESGWKALQDSLHQRVA